MAASRRRRAHGFTLVELLVVLVLVGIAAGLVALALRDPSSARLEQEAARLSALLEAGRAEARALGLPVRFELGSNVPGEGFRFVGLPPQLKLPQHWLNEDLQAEIGGARALLLGPEPLIGPQRITLRLGEQQVVIATDGLAPFSPLPAASTDAATP
ncbi:prepilin-type N-terminal cleavage/methylation domain-containing protein [Aquabacterium humicola]|uniref:prepilin-type N-terminal cleavage/methylation domain-containing protein n=1 Tax=Aquabacterium humicola TaxID=3237377 RepID=UPI0025427107|nr:prepilin-type N-terminal cleavage/methylation domain-containing protein [Rubrivivax pictus]